MKNSDYIPISRLCASYKVDTSFFADLSNMGLIEIISVEKILYLHQDKLYDIEKILRIHRELNVNIEGIDVVFNLLSKVDELQNELNNLRNRLRLYEND